MIYYKRKENLVFAKTAFICYFDNPSYYVARTQVVDKVKLLLTTFLFGKKCDIINVRVIIHSQQMHCQYSLFFINLL